MVGMIAVDMVVDNINKVDVDIIEVNIFPKFNNIFYV
jgi:hypothetical protein